MLINCPECGDKISDKCEMCVHCGYPYKELHGSSSITKRNRRYQPNEYIPKTKNETAFVPAGTVTCPFCHSTDVKKIGVVSRATGVATIGLASSKLGKQWHCNKCKSDF